MTEHTESAYLLINRSEFSDMRLQKSDDHPHAANGEAVFRLSRFALTFNNVTYATFGDVLGYWEFFPADVTGHAERWGLLPVWGYADVVESKAEGIKTGQRFYGYWPTATHVKLQPDKIGDHSFRDAA